MGFWGGLESTVLKANEPWGKLASWGSGIRESGIAGRSKTIAKSLVGSGGSLRTGGFAMRAGAMGAAGGAAGYASSNGDTSSTLKGFGLGVASAAAWTASSNSLVKAGARDAWGAAKSMPGKGWAQAEKGASYMAKREATLARAAYTTGKSGAAGPLRRSGRM